MFSENTKKYSTDEQSKDEFSDEQVQ